MHASCRLFASVLVFASVLQAAEPEAFRTQVVAHRGLLRESPENTLANFRACLNLGIGLEVDVRRSKDGHLVCLHDDTVDRTTDGQGPVSDFTLAELKALDAGGWFDASFRGEKIPTLGEVLALVAQQKPRSVLVAIDLKGEDERIEADVVQVANELKVLDRLVLIGRAIDHGEVRQRLKAADKRVSVAHLAGAPEQVEAVLADDDCDWAYLRFIPTRELVEKLHAGKKRVFIAGPATAGLEPANWRRAAVRGVDAVLTDYASDLARQLRDDGRRVANLNAALTPWSTPPAEYRSDFGKYPSPLKFADGSVARTGGDWTRRRAEIEQEWRGLLGAWPDLLEKPELKILATERRETFTQYRVHVQVAPGDRFTEGHLLVPGGKGPFPAALVTFYDSATSIGLQERGRGTHDYGVQLARRGFVTLSIGTPGDLNDPRNATRSALTDAGEQADRQPLTLLAYAAANCHTLLAQRPEVDPERIGVIGLSFGGKWAMFASCLYPKFACAVWSDPGIVFDETNGNVNYYEPWYLGYERGIKRPPGIPNAERPRTGLYKRLFESGRDLNELHPLICPRPVLVSGGTEDPPRNWRALNRIVEVNTLLGYENRVALTSRKSHVPTPEALELELQFLERFLKYE